MFSNDMSKMEVLCRRRRDGRADALDRLVEDAARRRSRLVAGAADDGRPPAAQPLPDAALVGAASSSSSTTTPTGRSSAPSTRGRWGSRPRECWSEIWHVIGPLIETPFHGGPATWIDDLVLLMNRHGFVEETHFTIAYSPVPDETRRRAASAACWRPCTRSPRRSFGERRCATLRDLGARAGRGARRPRRPAPSRPRRCRRQRRATSRSRCSTCSTPTAARRTWRRPCGVARAATARRPTVVPRTRGDDAGWPLAEVAEPGRGRAGRRPARAASRRCRAAPWSDPPHTADRAAARVARAAAAPTACPRGRRQPAPRARRRLPRLPRARRRPDRDRRSRNARAYEEETQARRGAGRARSREDRVLLATSATSSARR